MPKKKFQGYLVYAVERKEKYEKIAGRKLSIQDLLSYANNDWRNEPDQIQKNYKDMAKRKNGDMSGGFVHETSCNRIDVEGPVISDKEIGAKWEVIKDDSVKDSVKALNKRLTKLTNPHEILNWRMNILHFNVYVKYLEGLSVPAEVGIQSGTISSGVGDTYSNICNINPTRDIITGFRYEVKNNSELEHGIDPYKELNIMGEDVDAVILKIKDILMSDESTSVNLCRSEDVSNVLGCWFWIRQMRPHLQLPMPKIVPIEDFMIIVMKYLTENNLSSDFPKVSFSQLTTHLSIQTLEADLRCDFHNLPDYCDKRSCSRMNAARYFTLMMELLSSYIPGSYRTSSSSSYPNSSSGSSSYGVQSTRSGKQKLLPPTHFKFQATRYPTPPDNRPNNDELTTYYNETSLLTSDYQRELKQDYEAMNDYVIKRHELKPDDDTDNEKREPIHPETAANIPRRPKPQEKTKLKPVSMPRPRGSAGVPQNNPGGSTGRARGRRTVPPPLTPLSTPGTPSSTRSMSPTNSLTSSTSPPPNISTTTIVTLKDTSVVGFGRGRARRPMTNYTNFNTFNQ